MGITSEEMCVSWERILINGEEKGLNGEEIIIVSRNEKSRVICPGKKAKSRQK